MRYRPDLDGIRAVAVLAVMASHTTVGFCYGGWMGVSVFFVLSGYLITSLLLSEQARTGAVSLRRFDARRAMRLYPALLVLLLVLGVVFYLGLGYGSIAGYDRSAVRSGFYFENLAASTGMPGFLPHTWSLAVEEQFYLVWPPILVLLLWRGWDPLRWAVLGVVLSWSTMVLYIRQGPGGYNDAYYLPWSRFGELLVGCVLACMVARGVRAPLWIRSRVAGCTWTAAGIGLVYLAQYELRVPHLAWEAPTIALVTGAVIWHLSSAESSPLQVALSIAPLRWLGQRSYAIYLFHLPVLDLLLMHTHATRSELCAPMVAITFALAAVSYRFVESPFLRRKDRLQDGEATPAVPALSPVVA